MSKIVLRALEWDDMDWLRVWRNMPENRVYFREYRPLTTEHQDKWYNGLTGNRDVQMFAIAMDGELAGACGLCNIDWMGRSAEVSIYVGLDYIDTVIAPEALRILENYATQVLGLRRLWAEVWSFDLKKQTLLVGAEYQLEVTKRQAHWHDGWHDALIYGKLFETDPLQD